MQKREKRRGRRRTDLVDEGKTKEGTRDKVGGRREGEEGRGGRGSRAKKTARKKKAGGTQDEDNTEQTGDECSAVAMYVFAFRHTSLAMCKVFTMSCAFSQLPFASACYIVLGTWQVSSTSSHAQWRRVFARLFKAQDPFAPSGSVARTPNMTPQVKGELAHTNFKNMKTENRLQLLR